MNVIPFTHTVQKLVSTKAVSIVRYVSMCASHSFSPVVYIGGCRISSAIRERPWFRKDDEYSFCGHFYQIEELKNVSIVMRNIKK